MVNIQFGDPNLRPVKRVVKYELHGVAFIEGHEEPVGFVFEYYAKTMSLKMEALYQAKELCKFFNDLFKDYALKHSGVSKSYSTLLSDWQIDESKLKELIKRVSEVTDETWSKAFNTMIYK